jgi:hypothetical protein
MAGTMRAGGRRACLCAGGAVPATVGAMVVGYKMGRSDGAKMQQRLQVSAECSGCQLSWSALEQVKGVDWRQWGMSEWARRSRWRLPPDGS